MATIIMVVVAIILLVLHWKGPNAVWGGATLGVIVGLIVALVTGDWSWLALIFAGGTFAGTFFEWVGRLASRLAKRPLRQTDMQMTVQQLLDERQPKQMTVQQLALSMFRAVGFLPTEEEYQLVGISKLNMIKRRRFANVYRTLVLYLIRLSLPGAFPNHSSELLKTFDMYFQTAYENYPSAREKIEERLAKFQELTKIEEQEPFLDLALYVAELFERRPRKFVYGMKLNIRIMDMFFNFLTMGKGIEIKEGQSRVN